MKLFGRFLINFSVVFVASSLGIATAFAQTSTNNSQEAQVAIPPASGQDSVGMETEQQSNNPYLEYNKNSIYAFPEPYILFKRRIWREIHLNEPKNKPFFSRGQEITKFIVDGVKEGAIVPYFDEEFSKPMTREQFLEQLKLPKEEGLSEEEKALGFSQDDGWSKQANNKDAASKEKEEEGGEFFTSQEMNIIELVGYYLFVKNDSKFLYDIESVKIVIPGTKFPTGLRRNVATFKYKEVAAYLDTKPKEAVWINVNNSAANMRFTAAIELGLFDSRIVRIENPDNLALEDIYNKTPNHHLYAAKEMEEKLIELEQFVWES